MGASVVNALSLSYWQKAKPSDYKGQDLDKALKTYEGFAGKDLKIPADLIPKTPDPKVSAINDCIKDLQNAVSELQKGLTMLKQIITSLQDVQGAAAKTAADLRKQAKSKQDKDKDAYESAANTAEAAGSAATSALKDYQ